MTKNIDRTFFWVCEAANEDSTRGSDCWTVYQGISRIMVGFSVCSYQSYPLRSPGEKLRSQTPRNIQKKEDVDRGLLFRLGPGAIGICFESWVMLLRIPWLGRSGVHFLWSNMKTRIAISRRRLSRNSHVVARMHSRSSACLCLIRLKQWTHHVSSQPQGSV